MWYNDASVLYGATSHLTHIPANALVKAAKETQVEFLDPELGRVLAAIWRLNQWIEDSYSFSLAPSLAAVLSECPHNMAASFLQHNPGF